MSITKHLHHRQSRQTGIESDSKKSSADEKTNTTLFVISTQSLRKYNDNRIDIIKSPRQKTKTPLQELARDKDNKEE